MPGKADIVTYIILGAFALGYYCLRDDEYGV